MKQLTLIMILVSLSLFSNSQDKVYTKTGEIYFISKTSIINIDGTNKQVICFLNTSTGEIAAGMAMKNFEFTLPLAEEHFNENYVESDKYPNAKFSGKIINFKSIDISVNKTHEVEVEGNLTFHGVTKPLKVKGLLIVKDGTFEAKCDFVINIDDYKIKVPKLVEDKVAKEIPVKVNFILDKKVEKK